MGGVLSFLTKSLPLELVERLLALVVRGEEASGVASVMESLLMCMLGFFDLLVLPADEAELPLRSPPRRLEGLSGSGPGVIDREEERECEPLRSMLSRRLF